jgi:hypothetical protein
MSLRSLLACLVVILAACQPGTPSTTPSGIAIESATAAGAYADAVAVGAALVPPESNVAEGEITEQGGLIHYGSTASVEDLEAFYLQAIDDLGFKILKKSTDPAGGTVDIEFGRQSDAATIGSVDIVPDVPGTESREIVVMLKDPFALPAE